jgi:hypothetical protein
MIQAFKLSWHPKSGAKELRQIWGSRDPGGTPGLRDTHDLWHDKFHNMKLHFTL